MCVCLSAQDLTVTVMSERSVAEVEIVEDPDEMHNINRQSFIDEQEWLLYKCIEAETREVTNEYSDPPVRRSSLLVKCRAARRPAYFFWNIFLITVFLSAILVLCYQSLMTYKLYISCSPYRVSTCACA